MKLRVKSSFTCHSHVYSKNLQTLISAPEPSCPRAYHNLKQDAENIDWNFTNPDVKNADARYLTIDNLRFVTCDDNMQAMQPECVAYGTLVLHLAVEYKGHPYEFNEEDGRY